MTEHDKADKARTGLIDSIKGKAKEVAGAISGNDSLTAEGQLEQAHAQERKEANTVEAVADAEAEAARTDAAEARLEGARERTELNAKAAGIKNAVDTQEAAQELAATRAGQHDAQQGIAQAEIEAQRDVERAEAQERVDVKAATSEVSEAIDEHQQSVQEAEREKAEAERLRKRADDLTNQADLP